MITNLPQLLSGREFLSVSTADLECNPSGAPKFLLKYEEPFIYLIDYTIAKTIANLKTNPKASVSFMDLNNLEGYHLAGPVELIESGEEYDRLAEEREKRALKLSADRVIKGSITGEKHAHFELEMPDKFIVIKFKVEEMLKIGVSGELYRGDVVIATPAVS